MPEDRMPQVHDDQSEVDLHLSAEDLSGLGPDVRNLLRQLAASRHQQQRSQSTTSFSQPALPARIPSENAQGMISRSASVMPTINPPASTQHHRTFPNSWQQVAAQQPNRMALDAFDRQLLASQEPPNICAPYMPSDYYMPPVPSAPSFSTAPRSMPTPYSSLSFAPTSHTPTWPSSRLTLPSSLTNPNARAAATRTLYSPAMRPQPALRQLHEPLQREASPFLSSYSTSFPASGQPHREQQRTQSRDAQLEAHRVAPQRHHPNSSSITAQDSSSPAGVSSSSSPAAKAGLRRQLPQGLPGSSRIPTTPSSSSSARTSQSLALAHAPPIANGINLVSPTEVLPDRFRAIFPYGVFNAVQSKTFEHVYQTNDNLVVSAPTGSGKTVILELAICKLAHLRGSASFKIVYLCPLKALCAERANDWRQKFGLLAMEVAELTGDTSEAEMRRVRQATIIITTPEKWDSITRSWSDHRKLLDLVELFLIDEVHILKEPRGSTLEAVVSRMKTRGANVRFVALSATVPNSDDVASWLGRDHNTPGDPALRVTFGEEFRPVKLQKFVYGFDRRTNDYQFDTFLTEQLYPHIAKHSQKKPILVFCQTRKSCQSSAKKLAEEWNERQPQSRPWPEPRERIPVISPELQEILRYGVAFHHAGLDAQDRRAVEQAFLDGRLSVICCTSTLAMGLNLPCHMVVLKGTTSYQEGSLAEMSDLEFMQMLGRAGRPQFGNSGVAVVLTRARNKQHYEDMGSGKQILESTLHQNLIEHLNSEINLGTFQNISKAKEWLKGTFLAVRLDDNPNYYKLTGKSSLNDPLDDRLEEICETDISKLQEAGLVTEEATFRSTDYGWTMSRYVIRFNSMQKILQIPRGAKMEQVLTAICEADEFRDFRWRAQERDVFRELNKSPFIVFPIRETVTTMAHKVSLLVQVALGCVDLSDVPDTVRRQIALDTGLLFEKMHRLVRAVIECKASDSDGAACRVAHELARSMAARAWEGKPMQLTQIPQVGPVFMRKFVASGITTVHDLAEAGASNIERILSRNPPFGKKMMDDLAHFPHLTLEAHIATDDPRTFRSGKQPIARIDAVIGFSNVLGKPKWRGKIPSVTFMADTSQGVLAHWWRGSMKNFKEDNGRKLSLRFEVDLSDAAEDITCYFACEDIVGTVITRRLEHGLPATAFPQKPKAAPRLLKPPGPSAASLIDDDIGDNDLLEVLRERSSDSEACIAMSGDSDVDFQWPTISRDGKLPADYQSPNHESALAPSQDSNQKEIPWQPVQLPNGKFKCNHHCADVGLKNSSGKPCAHKCCREGIDIPRKPKQLLSKRKADIKEIVDADPTLQPTSKPSTKRAKTTLSHASKDEIPSLNSSKPLVPATANRPSHTLMDLDNFDLHLDGEGLIDLTQVEGTDVDAPHQVSRRRQNIAEVHSELLKSHSNSTDNFSGDSVFDGISVNECNGEPSHAHNIQLGTTAALTKQPGGVGSSASPPVMTRPPDQVEARLRLEKEPRAHAPCSNDSSSHTFVDSDEQTHSPHLQYGIASRAQEANAPSLKGYPNIHGVFFQKGSTKEMVVDDFDEDDFPSDTYVLRTPHTPSTTHDAFSQQDRTTGLGARECEEDTYIFSDDFVLPPPRESLGGGSGTQPLTIDGYSTYNVDASAAQETAKDDASSKNDRPSEKSRPGNPEWEGFEPEFTDEFQDLVEFI